jgi:hypothetical protein
MKYGLIIFIIILMIVGAFAGWKLKRPSLVIITSLIGGSLFGFGLFACILVSF